MIDKQKLVTKVFQDYDAEVLAKELNVFCEKIGVAPVSVNIVHDPDFKLFVAFVSYWDKVE